MAGNRTLHFGQYCMLVLLFLFNPVVRSLRGIEQASTLRKVQRKLGCQRASLGSLSESTDVFQPELLKEIIAELGKQLQPIACDPQLKDVRQTLTLVDGTLLKGLPILVQAGTQDPRAAKFEAKVRLHTQFDLERGVPICIDVTEGSGRGKANERKVLAATLKKGRCYVEDRRYAKFNLFNEIVAAGSSYVCRLRDNSTYEIVEQRSLCDEDFQSSVLLDALVQMGDGSKADARPDHPIRVVAVKTTPHEKRGGAAGPPSSGLLLIATNLLDLPAWLIALVYRYRWTIEVRRADYGEKDNLYRGGRWAYSSRTCVIETGPLVPAVQALEFRRKLMRYVREDVIGGWFQAVGRKRTRPRTTDSVLVQQYHEHSPRLDRQLCSTQRS